MKTLLRAVVLLIIAGFLVWRNWEIGLGILISLIMFFLIWNVQGRDNPHAATDSAGHDSHGAHSAPVKKDSRWPLGVATVAVSTLMVAGAYFVLMYGYKEFEVAVTTPWAPATRMNMPILEPTPASQPAEALVLMKECYTPCSADIEWRFKIRTDGHAIRIKFQGVAEWFDHPAEGDVQAPINMQSGETEFVSAEDDNPHVRVQVYKRIIVQGGQ